VVGDRRRRLAPEAIAAARDALPAGLDWELVRWNHLYGD
jgi:hypothetical protein